MVKTRFAPSPTGLLHIGGLRTALFSYLYAKKNNGFFLLRIEDTDKLRSTKDFEDELFNDLQWLGLVPDESPRHGGENGPYLQSERSDIYKKYIDKLLEVGNAYKCYCSKERLEEVNKAKKIAGKAPGYDNHCRDLDNDQQGDFTIRFKLPKEEIKFYDMVRGEISFLTENLGGDFIIQNSKGDPTYNFVVVVDDGLMNVTHILRGEDHLTNTPKQISIFNALNLPVPLFGHLPLVFDETKKPMSKRNESFSLKTLKEKRYLPLALLNATLRLGFAPENKFFTLEEMAGVFEIDKVSKSSSVFIMESLKHFNKLAIERETNENIYNLLKDDFIQEDKENILAIINEVKKDASTIDEVEEYLLPFTNLYAFNKEELLKFDFKELFKALLAEIESKSEILEEDVKDILISVKDKSGKKGKELFMPIRLTLTGMKHGMELKKIFALLGKEEIVKRIKQSLDR